MTGGAEYRRDQTAWLEAVNEMNRLGAVLPDGAQRLTAFTREMRFCEVPEEYLLAAEAIEGGQIVVRSAPGPRAVAFLAELREAVRQAGAA